MSSPRQKIVAAAPSVNGFKKSADRNGQMKAVLHMSNHSSTSTSTSTTVQDTKLDIMCRRLTTFINKLLLFKYSKIQNIQHGGSLFLAERLVLERIFLVTTNSCVGRFAAK